MKKVIVLSLIAMLLVPAGVFAQSPYGNPYGAMGLTPTKDQTDALKIAVEMMLLYKLLGQPSMVASNGDIVVLFGNKISKYDKDLNLVKEVNLSLDVSSMQELVSKVADGYSQQLTETMGGGAGGLMKSKVAANDALAKSTLRTLSTASETYATANSGNYPTSIYDLMDATPPYLNTNYCEQEISGFFFSCVFNPTEYKFTATPKTEGETGSATFTITTGGVMQP